MEIKTPTPNNSNLTRHKRSQISRIIVAFLLISNILVVYSIFENRARALNIGSAIELRPMAGSLYWCGIREIEGCG